VKIQRSVKIKNFENEILGNSHIFYSCSCHCISNGAIDEVLAKVPTKIERRPERKMDEEMEGGEGGWRGKGGGWKGGYGRKGV
jgi:hypothetical protein